MDSLGVWRHAAKGAAEGAAKVEELVHKMGKLHPTLQRDTLQQAAEREARMQVGGALAAWRCKGDPLVHQVCECAPLPPPSPTGGRRDVPQALPRVL